MNIYTGLLFQQGYIGNVELARSLAGVPAEIPTQAAPLPAPPDVTAPPVMTTSARASEFARCRKLLSAQRRAKAVRHSTALSLFR